MIWRIPKSKGGIMIRKLFRLMVCILLLVAIVGGCTKPTAIVTMPPTDTQVPPTPTSAPLTTDTQVLPTLSELSVAKTLEPTVGIAPIFRSAQVITSENAHEVTQLDYLGRGTIFRIAWSPDGTQIAVATVTGIYIVDTLSDKESHCNGSSSGEIAFSPDGTILAASEGSNVKLCDVTSGRVLQTLSGQTNGVTSLAFSPDGVLLASGSDYSIIELWDVASGSEVDTLIGPNENEMVSQLAFSTDGALLISLANRVTIMSDGIRGTGESAPMRIWDVASRTELRVLPNCSGINMSLSPDGSTLAVRQENAIIFCDIHSGEVLNKLDVNPEYSPVFSPDWVIKAVGVGNTIKLWDVATEKEIGTLKELDEPVNSIVFSPDGTRLASTSSGSIKIWDIANRQVLRTLTGKNAASGGEQLGDLEGFNDYITSVAFSPHGDILVAAPERGGSVRIYDVMTLKLLAELKTQISFVFCVAFSPNGKLIAAGGGRVGPDGYGSIVQIWDAATQEQQLLLDDFTDYPVNSLVFSPDSNLLATGEGNGMASTGSAKIWNVATGELLDKFGILLGDLIPSAYSDISDVAFTPDGTLLATASGNGEMLIWDVAKHMVNKVLARPPFLGRSLAISPDGKLLATFWWPDLAGGKAKILLWDIAAGEILSTYEVHEPGNTSVQFSPNGQILASAGGETVQLWDVQTGKVLALLNTPNEFFQNITFSPDGTLLATNGWIARLWGVPTH
jgi:WD40 repeat protein